MYYWFFISKIRREYKSLICPVTEDVGLADRGLLIGKEDSQVPDADSASDLRGSVKKQP